MSIAMPPVTSATGPLETRNPVAPSTSALPKTPTPLVHDSTSPLQAGRDTRTLCKQSVQSSTTGSSNMMSRSARRQKIAGLFKWEGRILEIDGDLFTAEIEPMGHEGPTLIADFSLDLLNSDGQTAEPGDAFYVTVRTVVDMHGYRHRTESIRAQRLGRWTADEVKRLREDAASEMGELENLFG